MVPEVCRVGGHVLLRGSGDLRDRGYGAQGGGGRTPDRTVVETDTPYLAPVPHRGEPNEPAHVALVGAALGDVWGLDPAEVALLTGERAVEVFGL